MKQIVLASQSGSRKDILSKANVKFVVMASDYEEDMNLNLKPRKLAEYLSAGKAKNVAAKVKHSIVIGADSFAVFKGKLLGKPHTKTNAIAMLKMLSGQCHQFISGFTIIDTDTGTIISNSVVSSVYFKKLSNTVIEEYVNNENVLDKAGAYVIQGKGSELIDRIEGSHENVEGLPIQNILKVLCQFGYIPNSNNKKVG